MTSGSHPRVAVSFADAWADPHAGWNACIELWSRPLEHLSLEQRPAALVWRYTGEINNGGHLQYLTNLDRDVGTIVPESIAAWRILSRDDFANILAEAHRRWIGAARLRPADAVEYVAVAADCELDDLDKAFYALDGRRGASSGDVLEQYFQANADRYVIQAPPETANEYMLAALGDPSAGADRELFHLDCEASVRIFSSLAADETAPFLVRSAASTALFALELDRKREAGTGA